VLCARVSLAASLQVGPAPALLVALGGQTATQPLLRQSLIPAPHAVRLPKSQRGHQHVVWAVPVSDGEMQLRILSFLAASHEVDDCDRDVVFEYLDTSTVAGRFETR